MIKPRDAILKLKPYVNGGHTRQTLKKYHSLLKLDSNESSMSPSPSVLNAIMEAVQSEPLQWYPDVVSQNLCEAIAQYNQMAPEDVLTFNGSDNALETICRTYLCEGDEVLALDPTYDHFRLYVESCGAQLIRLQGESQDLSSQLSQKITSRTKMVYIVNPNNPSDWHLGADDLYEVIKKFPQLLFLCDEAYFEFANVTVAPFINCVTNLVVTRSFSKAFGMAGIRCGYMMASPNIIQAVAKIRVGKSVSMIAQIAGCAALQNVSYMKNYVTEVKEAMNWLCEQLRAYSVPYKETKANFVLINVEQPERVVEWLAQHNILIRYLPHVKEYNIRITVADNLTMKRFWKVFEKIPQIYICENEFVRKIEQSYSKEG